MTPQELMREGYSDYEIMGILVGLRDRMRDTNKDAAWLRKLSDDVEYLDAAYLGLAEGTVEKLSMAIPLWALENISAALTALVDQCNHLPIDLNDFEERMERLLGLASHQGRRSEPAGTLGAFSGKHPELFIPMCEATGGDSFVLTANMRRADGDQCEFEVCGCPQSTGRRSQTPTSELASPRGFALRNRFSSNSERTIRNTQLS